MLTIILMAVHFGSNDLQSESLLCINLFLCYFQAVFSGFFRRQY